MLKGAEQQRGAVAGALHQVGEAIVHKGLQDQALLAGHQQGGQLVGNEMGIELPSRLGVTQAGCLVRLD